MTTYRLKADLKVCQGFANCVMDAPDLFGIDDDDLVVVLREEVGEDERARAERAVRSCPVHALTIETE
jgi:3-phenylpropionate/trans-cinnamate dioxygenase ferredoxin reductase subunit